MQIHYHETVISIMIVLDVDFIKITRISSVVKLIATIIPQNISICATAILALIVASRKMAIKPKVSCGDQ